MPRQAHLDETGQPRIIERRFVVQECFAGERLDIYLKRMIPRLSRTKLQEIIRTQLERAEGRPKKPHAPVTAGEELVIRRPAQPEPDSPTSFGVLYDDATVLVVDKPAGLAVHASAKYYFHTLTRLLAQTYPGEGLQICHRLDRETSGALVVARGSAAASRLKRAFMTRQVAKTYLAVVRGDPPWDERVIDLPLALVEPSDLERVAVRMEVREGGLPSVTRIEVLERHGHAALVRCLPVTGRQHQIRAHLAAAGHAIVGDKLYAHGDQAFAEFCDRGLTAELLARFELPRQALHAARVEFPHPTSGERTAVESPLPADLCAYLVTPR